MGRMQALDELTYILFPLLARDFFRVNPDRIFGNYPEKKKKSSYGGKTGLNKGTNLCTRIKGL